MYFKSILGTVICIGYFGISSQLPFTKTAIYGKAAESAIKVSEATDDSSQTIVSALLREDDFSLKFLTLSKEQYQIRGTLESEDVSPDIQYNVRGTMEEIKQNMNEIKSSEIVKKHVSIRVKEHKKEYELYGDLYQNQNKELFLYGWIVGIL